MPTHEAREKYGLHQRQAGRYIPIADDDEPVTEETKERDREEERNNRFAEKHNKLRQEISHLLDDKIFIADSSSFIASKLTGEKVQQYSRPRLEYEESDEGLEWTEIFKNIKARKTDVSLTYSVDLHTLQMLNKALLTRNLEQQRVFPEPDTPEILYRAIQKGSRIRYDKILGFRSSRQPLTPPYHDALTLDTSPLVDQEALRNHCEGYRQPSDLIALSDSPTRIFKITNCWDFNEQSGSDIAVINVSKLLAMGVLFNRTTTLAKSRGMDLRRWNQPKGLKYANPNYWVAYRWIPAECIERCTSISSLQKVCESQGIDENDHGRQFSLNELSELLSVTRLQSWKLGP